MEGTIINFRGSYKTKYHNQMIVVVDDIDNKEKAGKLLNKGVVWRTPSGKEIKGVIKNIHGNKGALRVLFEKGMPGQSLSTKVQII